MTRKHLKRINTTHSVPMRLATGGMLGTLAVGGIVAVSTHKEVIVDLNGEAIELSTFSRDVGGALAAAGIEVTHADIVAPASDATLEPGQTITVRTAKPVVVSIEGSEQRLQSTAVTVEDLLGSLDGISPGAALKSGDTPIAVTDKVADGMDLEVILPKIVKITDGDKTTFTKVAAATVQDVLDNRGIVLGEYDRLHGEPNAPVREGMTIAIDRVAITEVTETEAFEAEPTYIEDPELLEGHEEIRVPAVAGERSKRVKVTTVNGQETERTVVEETIIEAPTAATIARGTRPGVAAGAVWDTLAQCESGGNWAINTGNGFSGGLQFHPQTWAGFGGTQYAPQAWQATREQQIDIATRVQAAQGWGAWPACTARMGLR